MYCCVPVNKTSYLQQLAGNSCDAEHIKG